MDENEKKAPSETPPDKHEETEDGEPLAKKHCRIKRDMLEGEQLRPLPANWTQLLADEVERLADVKELINRLDPHQQKLMLGRMLRKMGYAPPPQFDEPRTMKTESDAEIEIVEDLQEDEKPVLAYGNEKIAEKDATQSEEDVRGGGQSSVPSPILEKQLAQPVQPPPTRAVPAPPTTSAAAAAVQFFHPVMAATVAQRLEQQQRQQPPINRQFFVQPPVSPVKLPPRFGGPFAPPSLGVLHQQLGPPLPPPMFMLPPRPTGFLPPQLQQQLLLQQQPFYVQPKTPGQQYKTTLCRHNATGFCKFGSICHFAHSEAELRGADGNLIVAKKREEEEAAVLLAAAAVDAAEEEAEKAQRRLRRNQKRKANRAKKKLLQEISGALKLSLKKRRAAQRRASLRQCIQEAIAKKGRRKVVAEIKAKAPERIEEEFLIRAATPPLRQPEPNQPEPDLLSNNQHEPNNKEMEMPVYMQRHLNRLVRKLAKQLDTGPSASHSAFLVNRFQSNLAASREGSSSTTVTVKMESTAFCSLAEEIGSTVAGAVEQRQKNGTLTRPSLLVMDVNRTLVSALCGGGEGGAGDYEFGPGEGDLGLQALLSIQPQIVDACERAFLRAIQQENEEERPGKKGKANAADPSAASPAAVAEEAAQVITID